jgi:hypothetical protein
MKVINPNNLPTIDYRKVADLQENLKDLETEQHDQLLRVLQKRGFDIPLFIWFDGVTPYLLDGHQRVRVMRLNELNDNGNYEVPFVEIRAPHKQQAVERLLEITSQYGKTTVEGLDELAALYELETDTMDIHFDAVDLEKLWGEPAAEEEPAKDKTPKELSFTIAELRDRRADFSGDDGGFVEWLAGNVSR